MGLSHGTAWGIGRGQRVRVMTMRHSGQWQPHAGAAQALANELRLRTSIQVGLDPLALYPSHSEFTDQGMALLLGDGDFRFSQQDREALKRWLDLGGFLFIDNNGRRSASSAFNTAVKRELTALYPNNKLERISSEHVVFRSFYRLDYPAGRVIRKPYLEGLKLGKRYAVIMSQNDLMGVLARRPDGSAALHPSPGGESQREMAIRLAINIFMYALCLHYKDDQVHLDYLLHKRKWKIKKPGR